VNPADMEPYVAPYVQVMHAIHLLYATSPRSRDDEDNLGLNHRFDKTGNRLPLELHGCGCSLCARSGRRRQTSWGPRQRSWWG
jgi:hypothetical protein